MTLISGDEFFAQPGVSVYLKSLLNHVSGEKLVFAHNLSTENMKKIDALGISVVPVPTDMIRCIVVDRWWVFYSFLAQTGGLENVLITDSKDVLFQNDPFEHPEFRIGFNGYEFLQFVSEGQTHEQSHWNRQDQFKFQLELEQAVNCLDWPVINGGVQGGSSGMLQQLGLAICSAMPLIQYKSTEQAYLNWLYQTFLTNDKVRVGLSEPHNDWLCLTGETVKWGANRFPVEYRAGAFMNPELARPYAIVHQWERTKFADQVLQVYN
jgi:hypothetical protein